MPKRILVKIGGLAFDEASAFSDLAAAIKRHAGVQVILVHGGGAEISRALKAAGRPTAFVDGIRVTAAEDMAIVEEVLSLRINARIAGLLEAGGLACRRLSGRSAGLFVVTPMTRNNQSLGFVGRIRRVDPQAVAQALDAGRVPVISPVSADAAGNSYNVNADTAAAALAVAAGCTDLVYFTDVPGVCRGGATCERLTRDQAREMIADGTIHGGMVAKLESVFEALNGRVARVHIAQWEGRRTFDDLVAECLTCGTTVTP